MATFRRGSWWWTDFTVNGQRFRQSLQTKDWREAERREKELISLASQGKFAPSNQSFARLGLGEALDRYLADRSTHVAPRSHRSESDHAKPLRRHFGMTTVAHFTVETILSYIRQRKEKGISNTTINMEIGILRRILKRAKRWHMLVDEIPHLPERKDVGRALAPDEKLRLLRVASRRPEWEIAYLASVLALNTTMRGCELKQLRWGDINLMDRVLIVRRSKTAAGERVIPINTDAFAAVLRLRARAKALFGQSLSPEWYVFPHAEGRSKPDPTQPMAGWRSAWRKLTQAIECPTCGQLQNPGAICFDQECASDISKVASPTTGLRFHDLRHHAITELAESLASDQTIMSIAGHVSQRMLSHYSHVRIDAKRQALDAISSKRSGASQDAKEKGGYGTKHDTKHAKHLVPLPQVIEKNGGDDETRTRDLCRDRAAF
jgi:integrase